VFGTTFNQSIFTTGGAMSNKEVAFTTLPRVNEYTNIPRIYVDSIANNLAEYIKTQSLAAAVNGIQLAKQIHTTGGMNGMNNIIINAINQPNHDSSSAINDCARRVLSWVLGMSSLNIQICIPNILRLVNTIITDLAIGITTNILSIYPKQLMAIANETQLINMISNKIMILLYIFCYIPQINIQEESAVSCEILAGWLSTGAQRAMMNGLDKEDCMYFLGQALENLKMIGGINFCFRNWIRQVRKYGSSLYEQSLINLSTPDFSLMCQQMAIAERDGNTMANNSSIYPNSLWKNLTKESQQKSNYSLVQSAQQNTMAHLGLNQMIPQPGMMGMQSPLNQMIPQQMLIPQQSLLGMQPGMMGMQSPLNQMIPQQSLLGMQPGMMGMQSPLNQMIPQQMLIPQQGMMGMQPGLMSQMGLMPQQQAIMSQLGLMPQHQQGLLGMGGNLLGQQTMMPQQQILGLGMGGAVYNPLMAQLNAIPGYNKCASAIFP